MLAEKDKVLTNVSIQYKNNGFVGKILYPVVKVNQVAGKYTVYNKADRFTIPNTLVSPKGNVPEVEWSTTKQAFVCNSHALKEFIPKDDLNFTAEPLDAEADTTEMLTDVLLLRHELSVKEKINAFPASQKDTPAKKWNASDGVPLTDIASAKSAMVVPPNTLILAEDSYNALVNNPTVLDRIKYTSAELPLTLLARLFGVEQVIIASAKQNTGTKASPTLTSVWSGMAVLAYVAKTPSLRMLSLGITPATAEGIWETFKWEENERGAKGGTNIKVAGEYDICTMAVDCGFLLSGLV